MIIKNIKAKVELKDLAKLSVELAAIESSLSLLSKNVNTSRDQLMWLQPVKASQ